MRHHGIPPQLIKVMKTMNDEGGIMDWFEVKSGVQQDCNMLGFRFLFANDWVMQQTVAAGRNGIRWNFMEQ